MSMEPHQLRAINFLSDTNRNRSSEISFSANVLVQQSTICDKDVMFLRIPVQIQYQARTHSFY